MEACPPDMVLEILSWASLKELDRCKLVSRSWNSLVYDSTFNRLHCQRTSAVFGFFVQNLVSNTHSSEFVAMDQSRPVINLSLDFLPRPVKIEASTNHGLLCCTDQDRGSTFYVCKPSTRQWRSLPSPKMRYFTGNVAMAVLRSDPLRFKILRLCKNYRSSSCHYYNNFQCEIFDSDTWAWREQDDVLLPPDAVLLGGEPAAAAAGAVHWLMSNNHVFAFDMDKESYSVFPLPKPVVAEEDEFRFRAKQLAVYKGRLAFICGAAGHEDDLKVWEMEDYYKKRAWTRREALSVRALRAAGVDVPEPRCVGFCNADVAVVKGVGSVIFYRFGDASFSEVKLNHHLGPRQVFPFRSDSDPIVFKATVS
ncbi:F-box protein At5g49610-like [Diospyros lotus]|uniref:F-box protein At5g49610-like n=1 Tax=Diospyros lotus TaxID=55363 RepID=UPI0022526D0A|nr:F-box protein At5g49610-like [Diospyros lotus]